MPKSITPPAPRHLAKTVTPLLPSRLLRRWASGNNKISRLNPPAYSLARLRFDGRVTAAAARLAGHPLARLWWRGNHTRWTASLNFVCYRRIDNLPSDQQGLDATNNLFKFLSSSGGFTERQEVRIRRDPNFINPADTYTIKITWTLAGDVTVYLDDEALVTHSHGKQLSLRYVFIGTDNAPGGTYGPQLDVIYKNLEVWGQTASGGGAGGAGGEGGSGGDAGTGGAAGAGGATGGTGGTDDTGGTGSGGNAGAPGGTAGTTGNSGAAGATAGGGGRDGDSSLGTGGGMPDEFDAQGADPAGCGCRAAGSGAGARDGSVYAFAALLALALGMRRRKRP